MANKQKAKGTRAESRIVKYLRNAGFTNADRIALHGSKDIGDVATGTPYNIEVKSGRQARDVFRSRFEKWINETRAETDNLPKGKACVLCIVEQGRALRDAKVFTPLDEEGSYHFCYFDEWVRWLADTYLDDKA